MSQDDSISVATQAIFPTKHQVLEHETELGDGKIIIYAGDPMLGSGSYGQVFPGMLKEVLDNGEISISRVAIKRAELPMTHGDTKIKKILEQELQNWMDLSKPGSTHDNVLQLLAGEVVQTGDHKLLALAATELMDMTLDDLIFSDKEFIEKCTYKTLLQLAEKVCEGLAHLHKNSFIHYDLKPSNVLVSRNARKELELKIADFGFTKKVDDDKSSVSGSFKGTAEYMAPEIMSVQGAFSSSEHRISNAVDIYSFGVLLWVLFNATKPSKFKSVLQDVGKPIKQSDSSGTKEIWCRAPDEVCDLIESCLSFNAQHTTDSRHGRPSAIQVQEKINELCEETWANRRPPAYLQVCYCALH